ncbi:MAG: type II CAAX prenyl endopeptidase Rce1 family protein [Anaerolineae bacterium]
MNSIASLLPNFRNDALFKYPLPEARESQDPQRTWIDVIPTIATIAAGCLLSSTFVFGLTIGMGLVISTLVIRSCLAARGFFKEDGNSAYLKELKALHPFIPSVAVPTVEELLFRGALLSGIDIVAKQVLPAMTVQLFAFPPMATATAVAVVASSALFGLAHLLNDHPDAWFQGAYATIDGLILGGLMTRYGIIAPIAAHIANNSVAIAFLYGAPQIENLPSPESHK